MRILHFLSSILGVASMLGCQDAPKPYVFAGKQQSAKADAAFQNDLKLSLGAIAADAYTHTFGALQLQLSLELESGKKPAAISSRRWIAYASATPLTETEKQGLAGLCQNIGLSLQADRYQALEELPADGKAFVVWRSYYSREAKQLLTSLQLRESTPFKCLLQISVVGENRSSYLVFEPIPDVSQKLAGTAQPEQALDEVIMLVDSSETALKGISKQPEHLYEVSDDPTILLMVPALHRADLQVKSREATGTPCRLHMLDSGIKVGYPQNMQELAYDLQSPKSIVLEEVAPLAIAGQMNATCAKQTFALGEGQLAAQVSCGDYVQIQQEQGLEAACQWSVQVANAADPINNVSIAINMNRTTLETVDVRTPRGAASVIPESPRNPVRLQTTDLSSFSPEQRSAMAEAFDFWIAASPGTFAAVFENFVKRISYMGTAGDLCSRPTTLAYVSVPGPPEIFWCALGGVRPEDLTADVSPTKLLLMSVTAFHEGLHTREVLHDIDVDTYAPCKGTAASAQLGFDTVVTCKEDFCIALRDFARFEYLAELDYSLNADTRRFEGQCQQWNEGLGYSKANFRT